MKIKHLTASKRSRAMAGFSLVEISISMGIVGTVIVALLSAFTGGFLSVQMARENLRARGTHD